MGHPVHIFESQPPPENCICVICHDVIMDATSLKGCGHTFCKECIEISLSERDSCPICRVPTATTGTMSNDTIVNYFARGTIDALHVRCPRGCCHPSSVNDDSSNSSNASNKGTPAEKRKRIEGSDGVVEGGKETAVVTAQGSNNTTSNHGCDWTGQVKDLHSHKDECGWTTVTCSIDGCDFVCQRKDMENHLTSGAGMIIHMNLMKQAIMNTEKKVDDLQEQLRLQTIHTKFLNDSRSWIEYKPDALFDFTVHRIRRLKKEGASFKETSYITGSFKETSYITGFVCGIPGPIGTDWEGAMIPLTVSYGSKKSVLDLPDCMFPRGFLHPNVYPSGRVSIYLFWTPEMTLPEILFTVQQLLGHPNLNCPAQRPSYEMALHEKQKYRRLVKQLANKYEKEGLIENANLDYVDASVETIEAKDVIEVADQIFDFKTAPRERPAQPTFQRDSNGNLTSERNMPPNSKCECSCCAWGQVFWDDQRRMRYLFGIPG